MLTSEPETGQGTVHWRNWADQAFSQFYDQSWDLVETAAWCYKTLLTERVRRAFAFISMTSSFCSCWHFEIASQGMSLWFFCWCLLTGDWKNLLHGDSSRWCYSLYNKYFITLLILYIHSTLRSRLVCLLVARFQRAVLYVPYCVLVCVLFQREFFFFNACLLNLLLGYTVVIL